MRWSRARGLMIGLAQLAWLAGGPGMAEADVVATADRRPAVDVRIVALQNGRLHYQLATGREVSRPIEEISYLQVTDWPLFNLAEKQQRDGQLRAAATSYERVLEDLARKQPGVDEASRLDRRLLARCRLAVVYDRQGQFDRAVATYLEVIEQMPEVSETLRPVNMPTAGSTFLEAARPMVEQAVKRHGQDQIAVSLARWLAEWPSNATQPSAATGPTTVAASQPSAEAAAQAARKMIKLAQAAVEAGRFDEALRRLEELGSLSPGVWLGEAYYWRGRAWLGLADGQTAEVGTISRRRAALAFMRVVVHFPRHPLAAECLYHAGEICIRCGQKEQANRLWSELVNLYPDATPWVHKAQQELRRSNG